jgi:hypothetical protein
MKKLAILGFVGVGLIWSASAPAQANTATASANAAARIVSPIAIAKTTDLNFGDVVAGGAAGTVVVTPAGARGAGGGATLGSGAAVTAAAFNVTGQANATYAITLPGSATVTSGVNTMTVNTFTSNPTPTGTLSAGGSQALAVGATLQVGANQATGTYTGTFDVTVAYN